MAMRSGRRGTGNSGKRSARAAAKPLTAADQTQFMLAQNVTHSDQEIGDYPLVRAIWPDMTETSAEERGRRVREAIWWLILWHRSRGLQSDRGSAATGRERPQSHWCDVCPVMANPDAWRVLYLTERFDAQKGFVRRLTQREVLKLGEHIASDPATAVTRAHASLDPTIRRLARAHNIAMLVKTHPATHRRVHYKPGAPHQAAPYKARWYTGKRSAAIVGLCAHLRPGDQLLARALRELGLPESHDTHASGASSGISSGMSRDGPRPAAASDEAHAVGESEALLSGAASGVWDVPDGAVAAAGTMASAPLASHAFPARDRAGDRRTPVDGELHVAHPPAARSDGAAAPSGNSPRPQDALSASEGEHAPAPARFSPSAASRYADSAAPARPAPLPRTALAVALALLLLCMLALPANSPVAPRDVSLATANVSGWFVARQWITGQPRILAVINPRSGEWHALWPADRYVGGEWEPTLPLNSFIWLAAPAYAPATRHLAFLSTSVDHVTSIWLASIARQDNGWPAIAAPGPRQLLPDCGGCSALAWSPDGKWLLYDTAAGLMALDTLTRASQRITFESGDGWPACSPDGRWLAYQRAHADIVALPAADCLPLVAAWSSARYLEGFTPAWRPSWSPDGRWLAFNSALGGAWSVYTTAFDQLSLHPVSGERDAARRLSATGCADPIWTPARGGSDEAIAYTCDAPTMEDHHAWMLEVGGMPRVAWQASTPLGVDTRDGLCWLPPDA